MAELLKEMTKGERIDEVKNVLDRDNVPEEKRGLISYMLKVQKKHDEDYFEESTGADTANVEIIRSLQRPMITRVFSQTPATEICGVWPLKQDQGKIAYMRHKYVGTEDNYGGDTTSGGLETLEVLFLADGSAFSVGGDISNTGSAAQGKVIYKEGNELLVKVTTGSFSASDSVDNANPFVGAETTINRIKPAEVGMHIFSDYTKRSSVYDGETATTDMKEFELEVGLENVTADSRKAKLRYTREFVQKLKDYYGVSGDDVTTSVGTIAFRQELNKTIFEKVATNSVTGGTQTWDYDADTDGRWEEEKIKQLLTFMNFRSADILKSNYMEPGNFTVIDPIMSAFFSSYGYLDMSMLNGEQAMPMRNPFVGVLNSTFRTYINPWEDNQYINMGAKDFSNEEASNTRAGIFFHPYLALDITQTIREQSGQPVKFFWSMYGFKNHPFSDTNGTNDFFRQIKTSNLPNL